MTHSQVQTLLLLAAVVIVLAVYDVLILLAKGSQATISRSVYVLAQRYPIVAFALGVIIGHVFWSL